MLQKQNQKILRLLIIVAAYGFVGYKIYEEKDLNSSNIFNRDIFYHNFHFLVFALLLAPVNWLLETHKWRMALQGISRISLGDAFKAVIFGTGVGLFTPNRIGDPFGRAAMLKPEHRARGAAAAIVCSMSQQFATMIFGIIGLVLWYGKSNSSWQSTSTYIFGLLILVSLTISVAIIFGSKQIIILLQRLKIIRKLLNGEHLDFDLSRCQVANIVLISTLRYVIFSTQLVMLLLLFGFTGSFLNVYPAIFLSYLFASIVPTFAIAEAGVKAGFGIKFIGLIWPSAMGIASASLLLWIINVALPGLVGVWMPLGGKR